MNKLLRYSFVVLMAIIGMNVSAQEVTLDFTSADNPWNLPTDYDKTEKSYMNGNVVITFNASTTGHKINTKDGYLIFGKEGATLTMTGFRFDVERIDIIGRSGASGSVKQNIFVGEEAVSTETTGATGTNIYKIAESHQGAGNVYTLKVLSAHNTQITKILIWKKGTAGDAPEPTHIENTEETAYTVAKAFELIDAGEALSETVFVKGIVSQVDSYNETYKSITYWISDDGTTDKQLQVYSGKGLEGADFASIDDVKVGAKVIIKGKIKKYNTTYEFDKNNELVKYEAPGATTTYKITIFNTEHGNITLDKYEAAAGEKVNVIGMSVDEGYEMNEPTIVAANGNVVEPGGSDEEGHYIIMPASDVMIFLNISKLYLITVNFDSSMGDVRGISFDSEKSPIYKSAGKNVKFTVTPKEGYKVESVTAADEDKNPITVNVAADLSYYEFEMPANNVTITALFSSSVEDTWTVAGTPPLTYNGWDPSDTNCDMTPNGNGEGVSSYERDNIVLEKGVSYECKVVKNHSWDENYPAENYVITVVETAKYHVKIFFNTTTHEITHEIAKMGEVDPIEDTWTVAGTIPLTDAEWAPSDTSGDMLPNGNGEGVSSYERNDIVLEAGKNYEFKVVKNHSWAEAYPAENYVITVAETAKYHVKIFFNTKTHEIFHEIQKTGEAGSITHTWSVIGTLVGNWDVDTEMTKGEDGLYKAEFENVAKGNYEFKVRADKLWTTAYPDKNYELNVEKDGSNVTVTFDEAKEEVRAIVSMPVSQNIVWSFTSWSKSTVSALIADAAASKTSGWSDVEKKADAEAGAEPTEASKDNCFWCVAEPNEDGELSANGEVIEELKGLKWNKTYTTARSLAIAVNYASTSLGDYAGGAYLWLGGGKKKVPCFTIPEVKAGSIITMEVESHKPAEGRGVELYSGLDADGLVDAATKIGDTFAPTTKDTHSWTIENDGDVIVYNTNGCHIYTIKIEAGAASINTVKVAAQNGVIYNLAGQKVGKDYKGIVIMNGKKFVVK